MPLLTLITDKLEQMQLETQAVRHETRAAQVETRAAQAETRAAVLQVQEQLAAQHQPSSSPSHAELGRQTWDGCQSKSVGIDDSVSVAHPEPLLTLDQHQRLLIQFRSNPASKENVWVALLTPRLMELVAGLGPHKLLVNSELIGWVRTETRLSEYFQRPDLFVCDSMAYVAGSKPVLTDRSSESSRFAASLRTDAFLFGSIAWPLRDALLCLLEAKVKIQLNEAIGEVFAKAQNILRGTTMASIKCCLFDMQDMYLLTFTLTGLLSSHRFALTSPGSLHALSQYILPSQADVDPPWLHTTRKLCTSFQVEPVVGRAFLGAGAHGKVFRVQGCAAARSQQSASSSSSGSNSASPLSETFALKVVDRRHQDSLDAEHSKLQALLPLRSTTSCACLPAFVSAAVHRVMSSAGEPLGSGLLLQPVGDPVWPDHAQQSAKSALSKIIEALFRLHRLNVIHGDARLENIIQSAGELVWIDFRECQIEASMELQRRWDLRTCINNFLGHYHCTRTEVSVDALEQLQLKYASLLSCSDMSLQPELLEEIQNLTWQCITSHSM